MAFGYLTVIFRTAQDALPVGQSTITVTDADGNVVHREFIEGFSGVSTTFTLEAPDISYSLDPDSDVVPYSTYDMTVENNLYYDLNITGIQIFAETYAYQDVLLMPSPESGRTVPINIKIGKHALVTRVEKAAAGAFDEEPPEIIAFGADGGALQTLSAPQEPRILDSVFIPQYITVHLGAPTSNAQNVTVGFKDYIKNVACSEIYPTWPENSIRANVIAQISLVLNRVYTEWYTSRGYPYNITNSTAYDQYFVYGRTTYESVNRIVDEIFNVYARKPGRIEPFYAEYCNGTTVTCPGMSQWGTVTLANRGYSPLDILEFYYGDLNLITASDVRGITGSYPGYPLQRGSSGENVRAMQRQLDRIAINYPEIPYVYPDGIYGPATESAVRTFQNLFHLSADGVAGKATWYQISYIFTAVTKLAELTSEGNRPVYNEYDYAGTVLRYGSVGTDVQKLQFFLDAISVYNPTIRSVAVDGRFGGGTDTAVRAFQRTYSLTEDGLVGKATWDAIVSVYVGTVENVDAPSELPDIISYPGVLVRSGSTGANVAYVQRALNAIGMVFGRIPSLAADGVFGGATYSAVDAFQYIFGLSRDGIVGRNTWDKMNAVYSAVASDCIYQENTSVPLNPYPGYFTVQGSSGSNVLYIQRCLNAIRTVLRAVPYLQPDGKFGPATANAVRIFQSLFGFAVDGIVGRSTWSIMNYMYSAVSSGCLSPFMTAAVTALPAPNGESTDAAPAALSSAPALPCGCAQAKESKEAAVKEDEAPARIGARIPDTVEDVPIREGSFGKDVGTIKRMLCAACGKGDDFLGSSYLFGTAASLLTKEFQQENGLPVTGMIDKETYEALKRKFA